MFLTFVHQFPNRLHLLVPHYLIHYDFNPLLWSLKFIHFQVSHHLSFFHFMTLQYVDHFYLAIHSPDFNPFNLLYFLFLFSNLILIIDHHLMVLSFFHQFPNYLDLHVPHYLIHYGFLWSLTFIQFQVSHESSFFHFMILQYFDHFLFAYFYLTIHSLDFNPINLLYFLFDYRKFYHLELIFLVNHFIYQMVLFNQYCYGFVFLQLNLMNHFLSVNLFIFLLFLNHFLNYLLINCYFSFQNLQYLHFYYLN